MSHQYRAPVVSHHNPYPKHYLPQTSYSRPYQPSPVTTSYVQTPVYKPVERSSSRRVVDHSYQRSTSPLHKPVFPKVDRTPVVHHTSTAPSYKYSTRPVTGHSYVTRPVGHSTYTSHHQPDSRPVYTTSGSRRSSVRYSSHHRDPVESYTSSTHYNPTTTYVNRTPTTTYGTYTTPTYSTPKYSSPTYTTNPNHMSTSRVVKNPDARRVTISSNNIHDTKPEIVKSTVVDTDKASKKKETSTRATAKRIEKKSETSKKDKKSKSPTKKSSKKASRKNSPTKITSKKTGSETKKANKDTKKEKDSSK